MFRYYKTLQQVSYSPFQTLTYKYKKEEISREEAIRLLSAERLEEIEKDLRQSVQVPEFPISTQLYLKSVDENTAEYIVITYYPLDLLIQKLSSLFPKSKLSEKLPIILSASHLTVIDKKQYLQLVAYTNKQKIPILTTTKKDAMSALKSLVKLHKEYKS